MFIIIYNLINACCKIYSLALLAKLGKQNLYYLFLMQFNLMPNPWQNKFHTLFCPEMTHLF